MNIDSWSIIFGYCGIKEIKNIIRVCKYFNEIIQTNTFTLFLSIDDKFFAIRMGCKYGHVKIVKLLLQDPCIHPNFEHNGWCPIYYATYFSQIEIVKLLLQDTRLESKRINYLAFSKACRNGNIKIVKLFLQDSRVVPGSDNNFAIRVASIYGHVEIVKLLLQDPRVDPKDHNGDALRSAYNMGHKEIVELLLNLYTKRELLDLIK